MKGGPATEPIMKRLLLVALLALACWLSAGSLSARAGEKLTPLQTALSRSTISGFAETNVNPPAPAAHSWWLAFTRWFETLRR
jgi:hypothetical protein